MHAARGTAEEALVDSAVEPPGGGPYDPALEPRVSRLESGMSDVKAALVRLEGAVSELRAVVSDLRTVVSDLRTVVARVDAQMPYLATKADVAEVRTEVRTGLADKPGKTYMWGVLSVLLTAYACGLAALAILK